VTGPRHDRRFPVEPLIAAAGSVRELARRAGGDERSWFRWRNTGITAHRADGAAIALGAHPTEMWGHDWYADAEVAS
jgi:hypothetical protein